MLSKIKGRPLRAKVSIDFLAQRVVKLCNSLRKKAVDAQSVIAFKTEVDVHLNME